MDFSFSESQSAVAQLASRIFRERITPQSLRALEAQEDRFDRKLWSDLASTGLLGTAIPEELGGTGQGFLELCVLLEEAGAAVAPAPLWSTLVLGALPITQFGTREQKQRFLPKIASGELVLTGALVESGRGDELPETIATAKNGGWSLTGTKNCVQSAHDAARILVPARLEGASGPSGQSGTVGLFLVDPKAKGVTLEKQVITTGESWFRVVLQGAQVAPEDVLGEVTKGSELLAWILPRATVALCAMELGVCERVLRMTASYATTRQQFERPIATFQAVSQRAGDAYVDVETIRVSTWQAAWQLAEGLPASRAVAMAKYWAAEAGHRVVYAAQHLHGGMGYDLDYPLHRYYLWSKQIELTLGSAPVQLAQLGAQLAG